MKNFLFAILMLAALPVSAQKVHYAFTLLAGPSLDWYKASPNAVINGAPSNRAINGTGYNIAIRYDYLNNTYVGFGTEIGFEHTSAGIFRNYDINGINQPFPDSVFVHTFAMNTLNIPVFIKIRLFNGRYNTSYTYFNFGPGIQYLLGAKRVVSVFNAGYSEKYPDLQDNPKFTRAVFPFFRAAMGRLIITRKYVFSLELAYNAGLSSWNFQRYNNELHIPGTEAFRRNSLILNFGIRLQNYRTPGCHEF
jgi:hypothetical protein